MQALTGPLLRSRGLRYKKKMWSFRTAADALPPALAPLAAGPVGAPVATGGGSAAAHVSYCMMTFIIRNGIKSLKQGPMQYEGYVDALVRRWGLPEEQRRRVQVSVPLDVHPHRTTCTAGAGPSVCRWKYRDCRTWQPGFMKLNRILCSLKRFRRTKEQTIKNAVLPVWSRPGG